MVNLFLWVSLRLSSKMKKNVGMLKRQIHREYSMPKEFFLFFFCKFQEFSKTRFNSAHHFQVLSIPRKKLKKTFEKSRDLKSNPLFCTKYSVQTYNVISGKFLTHGAIFEKRSGAYGKLKSFSEKIFFDRFLLSKHIISCPAVKFLFSKFG